MVVAGRPSRASCAAKASEAAKNKSQVAARNAKGPFDRAGAETPYEDQEPCSSNRRYRGEGEATFGSPNHPAASAIPTFPDLQSGASAAIQKAFVDQMWGITLS